MNPSREESIERSRSPGSPDLAGMESRIGSAEDFRPEQAVARRPDLPEVRGFHRSELLTDAEVQAQLDREFPKEHVSPDSLTQVRYTNEYRPVEGGCEVGTCTAYSDGTRRIEIHRQGELGSFNRPAMTETISHEVGHNVYWKLPPESQGAWESLSGQRSPADCVSPYAQTDAQEDFSESYCAYIHDPELLQAVSPDKYAFLRDRVFAGREYSWTARK